MNRALWGKAVTDGRALLIGLMVLVFGFCWVAAWLATKVDIGALGIFLKTLPSFISDILGMPISMLTTPQGQISVVFLHPIVVFSAVAWGIARGSDCINGEHNRGTLEMLLAQPVRRSEIVLSQSAVTMLGAALISLAAWSGLFMGMTLTGVAQQVPPSIAIPSTLNLLGLSCCMTGITTLVSSLQTYRWKTIGIVVGIYFVSLILKTIARTASGWKWLEYGSFLSAYEPQHLIVYPQIAWEKSLIFDGVLMGIGIVGCVLGGIIFSKRDIPTPS